MKCSSCGGSGRYYSVALYDGVAECGYCEGTGTDPETLCGCGRTYGAHWDENKLPEDCEEGEIADVPKAAV